MHPAIGRNSSIMRDAVIISGQVDLAEELGIDTGHEADKVAPAQGQDKYDLRGEVGGMRAGTPMGEWEALLGQDRQGNLKFGKTKEELAAMTPEGRKAHLNNKQRAMRRFMQNFMRTGKKHIQIEGGT